VTKEALCGQQHSVAAYFRICAKDTDHYDMPRKHSQQQWKNRLRNERQPSRPFECEEDVIERILRHLGLWQEGVRMHSGTDPTGETTLDPWLDDPFPDYDTEPVMAFSAI